MMTKSPEFLKLFGCCSGQSFVRPWMIVIMSDHYNDFPFYEPF